MICGKLKIALAFSLIQFIQATYAQSRLDSLLTHVSRFPSDSNKVQGYLDISWDLLRRDAESSLAYADSAWQLARKLQNRSQQAKAIRTKSLAHSELGNYPEAERFLQQALDHFLVLENKAMVVDIQVEFGWLMQRQSRPDRAMAYYTEALPIAETLPNKNNVARIHSHMAGIYRLLKQYEKALDHYTEALAIVEELDIKPGISACLTNIASLYNETGDYIQAIRYNERSLTLKKELDDALGAGRVLNNMGVVYNNLQRFEKANECFTEAQIYARQVNNPQLLGMIRFGQLISLSGMGEYEKSLQLGKELLPIADTLSDLELLTKIHQKMGEVYGKTGDYFQAYLHSNKSQTFSDSLYNEKIVEITNNLEAKYLNEQKQSRINTLTAERAAQLQELNKRVNERNWIIAFGCIALLSAGVFYHQYRIKQKTTQKLRDLDQAKSRFFANISHEFRTPLTLIKGPIDFIGQHPGETLTIEHIGMIQRNTNRLLALVNQLLDLSRIEQDQLKIKPTEGDLYACLRAATSSFNSQAAQLNIDYQVDIPANSFWTLFDRDNVEKIVYNLLSNAFKFTEAGDMILFRATYSGTELCLEVSDSGIGIPQEKIPFIFDRFFQVNDSMSKDKEGTGIGLALSRDLVELMGGTITVASEIGQGSFFTVHLPFLQIRDGSKSEDLPEVFNKQDHKISTFSRRIMDDRELPLILLVEDNLDMRTFLRENLQKEYRLEEATNGMEGLQKAVSLVPDLILTDLMMPKMDGVELCEKLKSHMATSHIPLIMLTARAGMENKLQGLESGADDYLTKPFEARELRVRASNLIEQRKKLRESYQRRSTDPVDIRVSSMDDKFLDEVLALLEDQHADSNFGIVQMQKLLGMSKSQLHRKLKALTNEAPGEFLRNFRLKRAARLLAQQGDNVSQIAYIVGFSDVSYFTKCFKSLYGVVPSRYPEAIQSEKF